MAKFSGLFFLARCLTKRRATILCYHGVSLGEEHQFRPKLFIRAETLEKRLRFLNENNFRVVKLQQVLSGLSEQDHADHSVVLTVDDGWYGFYQLGAPLIERFGFPATVYVTTYYSEKQEPVFNVFVQYIFWRSDAPKLLLSVVDAGWPGVCDLREETSRKEIIARVIEYGEIRCGPERRKALLISLGNALGVDVTHILMQRGFFLSSPVEIKDLAARGFDIQLHTHRHRFPVEDAGTIRAEIVDNRQSLSYLGSRELVHFCYPSGNFSPKQFSTLRMLGIRSATTTEEGLVGQHADPLALPRFVDGEDVRDIEFEAALVGFTDLVRRAMDAVRPFVLGGKV